MKQKMYQQFIYKVSSDRILGSKKKNLIINPHDARMNGELISLADSNVLRVIDTLNGVDRAAVAAKITSIRGEIRQLQQSTENKLTARKRIKELYAELDNLQLKTDYFEVVMSKNSDFDKLNRGFSVNGIEYRRLVGTSNGVKQKTVVYCSVINAKGVHIHEELDRRMNGGRDENKELVPAKYEAYKALACSASILVSMPKDILVVDDFVLTFTDDFIELKDAEDDGEPVMTEKRGEFELNASDGFGLMCPALAKRWSEEIGLDYTAGGMCIRSLFAKGMAYAFDFHEFARRYYDGDTITDVWGGVHTISDVELIVPVSVMKLWDSYRSLSHYLECCERYGHGFAVTKTCEKELENERTLNYQFIQSYDLTDDEIAELVQPTVDEIKETICGDVDKTLLFLRGACGKNYDFNADTNYLAKAIMIEPRVAKDPYTITTIGNMIKKRIDDLKIGVLKVHGNYTVISGDPFAFCQKIFGCDVPDAEKGLLRAGEMYSKYWADNSGGDDKRVVCFRAPMSCHNNIRTMNVVWDEDIDYWYRYMNTVNIINCHDTFYAALNGADNDGDAILTTDNGVLLRNTRDLPAIMCVQKKAEKCVITEELLAASNKLGFGDAIGAITNRVTAMYDVMSRFGKDSEEYKTLAYRVMCGQLYQQAAIDKIKGIISKPMPKSWYDYHSLTVKDDDDETTIAQKEFNKRILAEKKPYFMKYIYSKTSAEYNKKSKNMAFNRDVQPDFDPEKQDDYDNWYTKKLPVSDAESVMNRLCHYVEKEFKRVPVGSEDKNYPYQELLASKNYEINNLEYNLATKLKKLYNEYCQKSQEEIKRSKEERVDDDERNSIQAALKDQFRRDCEEVCSSEEMLCDILLKLCYKSQKSKKFVWDLFGRRIVDNLLEKNGKFSYFTRDSKGETVYGGNKYKKTVKYVNTEENIDEKLCNE